ncbi:MAG: formylglycine-generating enzyme family protein [Phaeodactylibacter sp.]|uniref:formylglycine-generating enzyme family protein n=1 Tax=Phaeodactylibacter sp. TaxID=1940289 RepID=UPI0032EB6202
MSKFSTLLLVFCFTATLKAQDGPIEDYIANYYQMLNNLGDASLPLRDRRMFRSELLNQYFLFEGSMIWNELRPEGSRYIPPREYLDLVLTDFPEGVSFSIGQLEVLNVLPKGGNLNAEIRLTATVNTAEEVLGPFPLKFILSIREYSPTGVIARIRSIDKYLPEEPVPEKTEPVATQEAPPENTDEPEVVASPEPGVSDQELSESVLVPVETVGDRKPTDSTPMVLVYGGTFQMGAQDKNIDNRPVHTIRLDDFYIGKFEVTFSEFSQFMESTDYVTDAEQRDTSQLVKQGFWGFHAGVNWRHDETGQIRSATKLLHPVIHVSWNDAIAYCNWLSEQHDLQPVYTILQDGVKANWNANGYRLPTEAEWEYAARDEGEDVRWSGTSYSSNMAVIANFCDRSCVFPWKKRLYSDDYALSAPVGMYRSNDLGVHDMSGNVQEWCWDYYETDFYARSPAINPIGPLNGEFKLLRGGSWGSTMEEVECAHRKFEYPDRTSATIGFRLCRNAK